MKIFLDVMYDDTKNARKIKSCDYNNKGKYPIIDQSSKNVIGYTDEVDGLYKDVPVIIFGDHTRRFKLVEEPFFIGADGTKVLKLCSSVYDYKFIYYYLLHKKIPDTGYNRHFKWVKELEFPEIPRSIQSDIVQKFEVLNDLISRKNKLLELFDILIKSRFDEMFGDPVINNKKWTSMNLQEISIKITSGNTPQGGSRVYINHGVLFIRSQNVWNNRLELDDVVYISESFNEKMKETRLRRNDILITKTGRFNTENSSLGRCALYTGPDFQANINGHVYLVRLKSEYNPNFILSILTSEAYKKLIRSVCVGGIDKRQLNKSHIELFPIIIPPIELQNQYIHFLLKINKLKSDVQKSIDETQLLMDSLMQEYFG